MLLMLKMTAVVIGALLLAGCSCFSCFNPCQPRVPDYPLNPTAPPLVQGKMYQPEPMPLEK
jgi:hypothetical protein